MENKKPVFKAALILILVFIIGFLAGIGSVVVFWQVKMHSMPFMQSPTQNLQLLTKTLKLNDKQQVEIGKIIRQTRSDLTALREELRPKVRKRLEQAQQQIAALLTDEQKVVFTQLIERRKAQLKRWKERRSRWMDNNS